eukprot:9254179-Lingulodinium_polyedra.AAC.1
MRRLEEEENSAVARFVAPPIGSAVTWFPDVKKWLRAEASFQSATISAVSRLAARAHPDSWPGWA